MDRTREFREAMSKERAAARETGAGAAPVSASADILPAVRAPGQFAVSARALGGRVRKVRALLASQRRPYLNFAGALSAAGSGRSLSDAQRDELELTVAGFAKEIREEVAALNEAVGHGEVAPQVGEHRTAVVQFLEARLADLRDDVRAMVGERVKHAERRRARTTAGASRQKRRAAPLTRDSLGAGAGGAGAGFGSRADVDDTVDDATRALLAQENEDLLGELHDEVDAAHQAERSMVEISRMMEVFSTEVTQQGETIESIGANLSEAEIHVKLGNKALEDAEKYGVGFRVWILFVLVTASLSLLFLDHIYD